ncbi:MAG TPA: ATP-grasp domain-containing protein [Azospirillum sp.]|nr:ATP-grasp domain-containing protein [Azospirillum sp.]
MIDLWRKASGKGVMACVMGSMNLVRPIGLAGVRCAVVTRPGNPTLYSRFTRTALYCDNFSEHTDSLVEDLVHFGQAQLEPPVLFFEEDPQLLLVSRYRDRLSKAFRFVIADAQLVESLVDKTRFQALAERLALPVPATRRLRPTAMPTPPDLDLRFPLIIKPATRDKVWKQIGEAGKARQVDSPAALRELWPYLIEAGQDLLAQEMIPGPESRIESYHVYVDRQGALVAEFTGRKIRTYPVAYGHTTALTITDEADVRILGRTLTDKLNLRGVAKFDFKRGPDGTLHLLEVNPRFNLWHLPGALAGVNLPALVYADLVGLPRPAVQSARAGVRWCHMLNDLAAARASGLPLSTWARWAFGCEAKSTMAWDDPMPFLQGVWHLWSAKRAASGLSTHAMHRGKL